MAKRSSPAPKATPVSTLNTAFLHVPVVATERDAGIDNLEIDHLADLTKETLAMELSMWTGQVTIWEAEVAGDRQTPNAQIYLDEALKNKALFEAAIAQKAKK